MTVSITAILLFSIYCPAGAQWNVPIGNSDYGSMMAAGQQINPSAAIDRSYRVPLWSQQRDQLAAQLAPQFAQLGSQYPGYGGQSRPMDPSMLYLNQQPAYGPESMTFPVQTRPAMQPLLQPGGFGLQSSQQGIYSQLGYGGMPQAASYGSYQADDFMGTIEKPKPIFEASPPPPSSPIRVIPPFLEGQSKEDQDKFYAIVQHPTWSPSEKSERIEELVRNMSTTVQNTFAMYQRAESSDLTAKRQRVHEAVASMSPEAQQQFQKVSALMTNPQIPEQERLRKIEDLYTRIPDSIKREFDAKFINL
ncbi:hypothetical protein Q1695_011031 [Nippostrongylus brasiliensis]|nr:hypothetical protein Q1695_011031 [Nippostrongylus brasiliensis]